MQMLVRIIIPPAAQPWIERPVIKVPILVDVAQAAEPAAKITTDTRRMIFRPQISDSLAHTGVAAALDRR